MLVVVFPVDLPGTVNCESPAEGCVRTPIKFDSSILYSMYKYNVQPVCKAFSTHGKKIMKWMWAHKYW